jgi:hypothetical protein
MDERLEKAISVANLMVTFNNQRKLLKQEYKEQLLYHIDGYRFTINLDLINFVSFLTSKSISEAVLIDDNENPCKISNLNKFKDNIMDQYFQANNDYYSKYSELKKKRTVTKLTLES